MLRGVYIRSAIGTLVALSLASFTLQKARGEFPPEGAVTDPKNPSIASGDLPDPSHKGALSHYIFYFDCGKHDWIGVSVTNNAKAGASSAPQAVGLGREFPPGPPLGAKTLSGSSDRAIVAATGQIFVLENGNWIDIKTKKTMRSPNLCPEAAISAKHATRPEPSSQPASAGVDKLTPPAPIPKSDQKPDQLPPPPKYVPGHTD